MLRRIALVLVVLFSVSTVALAQHTEHYEIEPNDLPAQANPVTMQSSVVGNAPLGDVDYFRLPTPEYLATHQIHIQIYTPHPPLQCVVTVSVRNEYGPGLIVYHSQSVDWRFNWTAKQPVHYISIQSTCEDLHYQIDFIRIHGPYQTYLPLVIR